MAEVEELLKEGKRLGLQLRGLPKLISMMAQARSFNMRARRALHKGAPSTRLLTCLPLTQSCRCPYLPGSSAASPPWLSLLHHAHMLRAGLRCRLAYVMGFRFDWLTEP